MNKKFDRRSFIKGAAITGAGVALGGGLFYGRRSLAALLAGDQGAVDRAIRDHKLGQMSDEDAQAEVEAYMTSGGGPGESRVVHIHDPDATSWNFSTGWYGDYVDQPTVDNMVDRGIMELTGTSTVAGAWQSLIPNYAPGKAIAIKVNFNNAGSNCAETNPDIDALIHPVNAMVKGLKQIGVAEADIWVYDATRPIPDKFVNGCLYPSVRFFGTRCQDEATFDSADPNAVVHFSCGAADQKIPDVLVDATYLINVPIVKKHGGAGITLSFKNHLGTIPRPSDLHNYLGPGAPQYAPGHNPMVDIWLNPHVGPKTRLVVGDGLFGNRVTNTSPPQPWTTFGGEAPNSLFFAVDPVAIDCVMCDLLEAESGTIREGSDVYLQIARDAGLGIYERGDPWGSGYNQIDYMAIEL